MWEAWHQRLAVEWWRRKLVEFKEGLPSTSGLHLKMIKTSASMFLLVCVLQPVLKLLMPWHSNVLDRRTEQTQLRVVRVEELISLPPAANGFASNIH